MAPVAHGSPGGSSPTPTHFVAYVVPYEPVTQTKGLFTVAFCAKFGISYPNFWFSIIIGKWEKGDGLLEWKIVENSSQFIEVMHVNDCLEQIGIIKIFVISEGGY